jgi:cell division cycle 14
MPFRDAGRGRSDFNMSIHDCLWGFWKAQRNDLINMNNFSVEDYEYYEKVENGDWNWITPGFIAFASPTDATWIRQQKNPSEASPSKLGASSFNRKLPQPYQNCLEYFEERSIKLVVRLNNPLYDKATFEERGMEHLELYFDDGTNPTDEIVREFISRSEAVHEAGGVVAVHVGLVTELGPSGANGFQVQGWPWTHRYLDRRLVVIICFCGFSYY